MSCVFRRLVFGSSGACCHVGEAFWPAQSAGTGHLIALSYLLLRISSCDLRVANQGRRDCVRMVVSPIDIRAKVVMALNVRSSVGHDLPIFIPKNHIHLHMA